MEKKETSQSHIQLWKIPRFYENVKPTDNLECKIREQARALFLERLSKETVDSEELQHLWSLLEKSASSLSRNNRDQKIDYVEFKHISSLLKPDSRLQKYFTASTFAKLLQNDPQTRISILTFFNYVMRKIWMQQARVSLSFWDSSGKGFLTEYDLENYIRELIPTFSKLNRMDKSYYPFYICVTSRKFCFFLDPHKHNKIKIVDILCSGFLDELLELRNEDVNKAAEEQSWFSVANTMRLYNIYLSLDENQNGMLSKMEFMKYGHFTHVFVDRLFEVCVTYNSEIDFKAFIDIMLALENRKEIQAIHYLFKILDINSQNYLDDFTLRYFFKPIQNQMKMQGLEPINFTDFSNEIYDMVRSSQPRKISIRDLLASGHADTIISILIDYNGFYAYENRDSNIRTSSNKDAYSSSQ